MDEDRQFEGESVGASHRIARFGEFRLDLDVGELRREGALVALRPKAVEILVLLVRSAGRLVPREDLVAGVWGDTHVDVDAAVHTAIREVRQALDDDASDPRFVETVHRRGYRFAAEVELGDDGPRQVARPADPGQPAAGSGRRVLGYVAAAAAAVVLLLLAVSWPWPRPAASGQPDAVTAPGPVEEASDAVLRGRYLVHHGTADELADGVQALREATSAGDAGVLAWSGLAVGEMKLGRYRSSEEAAREALRIDSRSAEALRVLGQLDVVLGRDLAGAERLLLRALELDPSSGRAQHAYALLLMASGRREQAVRMAETAVALAPAAVNPRVALARYLLYATDLEGASRVARRVLEDDPDHPTAFEVLQVSAWLRGDTAAAREAVVEYAALYGAPDDLLARLRAGPATACFRDALAWLVEHLELRRDMGTNRFVRRALLYAQLGELDRAVEELRRVGDRPSSLLPLVLQDPRLDPLRDRQVVQAIAARYRMPPAHG